MALSTFESLPDEILMLIFRYSTSVYDIFQAFCGLNRRLTSILTDRRSHLFADFLCIKNRKDGIDEYYHSSLFPLLLEKLHSIDAHHSNDKLQPCFQMLVTCYIQEKYRQFGNEFSVNRELFLRRRRNLNIEDLHQRDAALKQAFNEMKFNSVKSQHFDKMTSLVLEDGASLECTNYELGEFNLAGCINQYLLSVYSEYNQSTCAYVDSLIDMLKALIICNPQLLQNKYYVGNGGAPTYFFLFYAVFRLKDFYTVSSRISIKISMYQFVVKLLLFVIQCLKHSSNEDSWLTQCMLDSFSWVITYEDRIDRQIIIHTSQIEICKILIDEFSHKKLVLNEESYNTLHTSYHNLVSNKRIDIISLIIQQRVILESLVHSTDQFRQFINIMTGSRSGRSIFKRILDENYLESWFFNGRLLFILLDKKECKLVKRLLCLLPNLIDQVDDDGNNPLLYVCLKVSGCRHRLIEWLIRMGCDLHRKNKYGEDFFQVLQLDKCRILLNKLIDHEIIVKHSEIQSFHLCRNKLKAS